MRSGLLALASPARILLLNFLGPLGPSSLLSTRYAEGLAARATPPPVAAVRRRGRSTDRAGDG